MPKFPAWIVPATDSVVADAIRRGKSPWSDAVHVLWSAWVFITPAFAPAGYSARWWALTLVSYPLYLFLYAMTLLAPERTVHRYALAMIALCLLLLPWYPSGMSYFVFGCVMLRPQRIRSLAGYLALLMLLSGVFVGYALLLGYPWQAIVWMPAVSLIVGTVIHVEKVNHRKDIALRLSHEEVRRLASSAERERIGRDLHDLLGHTLSLVALKSDLAGKLLDRDPSAARREIDEVSRVARDALSQVRRAVTGIRAAGLAAELASARLLLESDGVGLEYHVDPSPLPPELETVLALTLREALTNIQRHAQARHAEVSLKATPHQLVLCIHDDGRGSAIVPGNGLAGMRERLEALGGSLRVESAPRLGTRLEATLPLPDAWSRIGSSPLHPA